MKETKQAPSVATGPRLRRHYDRAFKEQAVAHYQQGGGSIARVAAELGVNVWTLRDWIEHHRKSQAAPLPQSPEALQSEVHRLRQELERVTQQRDILKKSLGILSTT